LPGPGDCKDKAPAACGIGFIPAFDHGHVGLGTIGGIAAYDHQLGPTRGHKHAHHLAKQGIFTTVPSVAVWTKYPNALLSHRLRLYQDSRFNLNFMTLSPILLIYRRRLGRGDRGMDWKKLLGSITESVDAELRLRNAYLVVENRMLRQQISGR